MNDGMVLTSGWITARHSGATVPEFHGIPSGVMIVHGQTPKSKNDKNLPPQLPVVKSGILRSQPPRLLVESTSHVKIEPLRRDRPVGDASGREC